MLHFDNSASKDEGKSYNLRCMIDDLKALFKKKQPNLGFVHRSNSLHFGWNRSGIMTGLWVTQPRNRGSIYNSGKRFSLPPNCPDWFWGSHSPLFVGTVGFFSRGDVAGRSVEGTNECSYTSSPPYAFVACVGSTLPSPFYIEVPHPKIFTLFALL
jgi:hypothetical protein